MNSELHQYISTESLAAGELPKWFLQLVVALLGENHAQDAAEHTKLEHQLVGVQYLANFMNTFLNEYNESSRGFQRMLLPNGPKNGEPLFSQDRLRELGFAEPKKAQELLNVLLPQTQIILVDQLTLNGEEHATTDQVKEAAIKALRAELRAFAQNSSETMGEVRLGIEQMEAYFFLMGSSKQEAYTLINQIYRNRQVDGTDSQFQHFISLELQETLALMWRELTKQQIEMEADFLPVNVGEERKPGSYYFKKAVDEILEAHYSPQDLQIIRSLTLYNIGPKLMKKLLAAYQELVVSENEDGGMDNSLV